MKTKDGGPAFPTSTWREEGGVQIGTPVGGISKRELFAAVALLKLTSFADTPENISQNCFKIADAMIAESERES